MTNQVIDSIGLIGSVVLSVSFIPQTYHAVYNIKNTNIIFVNLMILCSTALSIYSYYYRVYPMLIANCSVFVNNFIVLSQYFYSSIIHNSHENVIKVLPV